MEIERVTGADLLALTVLLQKMPEIEDGRFVGQAVQLQTCEATHRLNFV